MSQGTEDDIFPIWRGNGVANHFWRESFGLNFIVEMYRFSQIYLYVCRKGNIVHCQEIHINFVDFSTTPKNDFFVVWHPTKIWINAKKCPSFLLVFVQFIVNGPFLASFQIVDIKNAFGADPFNKS